MGEGGVLVFFFFSFTFFGGGGEVVAARFDIGSFLVRRARWMDGWTDGNGHAGRRLCGWRRFFPGGEDGRYRRWEMGGRRGPYMKV